MSPPPPSRAVLWFVNVHKKKKQIEKKKWLNWFHFFIIQGGLLFIVIDCMIFLSPFLDVTRISICFPLTYDLVVLSVELTDIF